MDKEHLIEFNTSALAPSPGAEWIDPLVFEGELLLLRGKLNDALERFNLAETLSAPEASLYFREGLALLEYGSSENHRGALAKACKKFKQATVLSPAHYEAWHSWGNTLLLLGELSDNPTHLQDACTKFCEAVRLAESSGSTLNADLYWDLGNSWRSLGEQSEEAVDLQSAIQAYQKASSLMQPLPAEFWTDFGETQLVLFEKVRDMRVLAKAISCFKYALTLDNSHFPAWEGLAHSLQLLYFQTHEEEHFSQCSECYANATKVAPRESMIWLDWAEYLVTSAELTGDSKRARAALEKCHQAYVRDPKNPQVLSIWAEALALLGQLTERLDLLYEAQNKISEVLELTEDDPLVWRAWGRCLCAFASYFSEVDYYYQAIEKFQTGLSIDRTALPLWEDLATAYSTAGHLENDVQALESSLKFFQKAQEMKPSNRLAIQQAVVLARLGELMHQQTRLEQSVLLFEQVFVAQKNALYIHPDWLFHYASTLDLLGDYTDSEQSYTRAIEIFTHVLMLDPDFPRVHHRLAQAYCHLGELLGEVDHFYRSVHHLRLALKQEEEDDQMILDWGIVLINIAQHASFGTDVEQLYKEAEQKIVLAAKLGNISAFYHLSCLYSIQGQYEKSFHFLLKAQECRALPSMEELLSDDWLDGLRMTADFRSFIARYENRANYEER